MIRAEDLCEGSEKLKAPGISVGNGCRIISLCPVSVACARKVGTDGAGQNGMQKEVGTGVKFNLDFVEYEMFVTFVEMKRGHD